MKSTRNTLMLLAALMLLAFTSASATARRAAQRIHVFVQTQETGEWQVFVFGAPHCPDPKNVQVIFPKDSTQPLEIECDVVDK